MQLRFFLSLLLVAFCTLLLYAQHTPHSDAQSSPILNLIGEDSLALKLKALNLFDAKQFKSDTLVQKINRWLDDHQEEWVSKAQTSLGLSNYFFSNATPEDSLIATGQLFTGIDLSTGLNLFGIPVQALGNATLRNGLLDPQFSDFALQFDQNAFLKNLKQRHLPKLSWNSLQNNNPQGLLDGPEKKALLQELRYTFYKKVMDNPAFRRTKDSLFQQLDTLNQKIKQDSSILLTRAAEVNALRARYQEKLDLLLNVERKFLEVWDYKSQYWDSILQQAKTKLQAQRERLDDWANPQRWQTDSLLSKLTLAEKAFVALEDLSLGQFSIQGSDFTLFQMPLQGGQLKLNTQHWFAQVASGRQRLQFGFAPSYGRLLFNPAGKKYFNYVSIGSGNKEKTFLQLALCEASERNRPTDSIPVLNKQNLVWEMSGQFSLSQHWALSFTTALADLALGSNEGFANNTTSLSVAKSASKFQVVYQRPQSNSRIALGYFYTGAEFITLGNPFLRSNWKGLSIEGNTALFNQRLQIKGNAKLGSVQDTNAANGKSNELQFFGQIHWRMSPKSQLVFQMLPNRFVQSGYAQEKIEGSQTLYQLQWHRQGTLGKSNRQWLSSIGLSNYQFNYQLIDSINTRASIYGTIQQSLVLSSKNSFTASFSTSTQSINQLDDWLTQLDFNRMGKKLGLKIGLQALRQHWYQSGKWGINLGAKLPASPKYSLSMNLIYRRPFKGSEPEQIIGNCSFSTFF